ncbi:MAG: hypothetical protein QM709_09105 [Spongiibacteraceae bacterium]
MSDDDQRPLFNRPAAHLLDELESIKGLLADEGDGDLPADIPLLDDMVIHNLDRNDRLLNSNTNLLNLGQIFDEEELDETNAAPEPIDEPPVAFPRFTLDVTICDDNVEASDDDIDTRVAAIETSSALPPMTTAHSSVPPSRTAERPAVRPSIRPDYSREVLIQELVDAFIPQIEAELHRRLQQMDDILLRRLKDTD